MDLVSLTLSDWEARMRELGQPKFRAKQILGWIHRKRAMAWDAMTDLPADLRSRLTEEFPEPRLVAILETGSADTTRKFLFRLADGQSVETVLIPASPASNGEMSDRRTLCVSTQVGCAYGCKFCASGLGGWKRNLSAGEIVDQLLQVESIAGERVGNLVFMGMGEPLANFDNLLRSIEILNAPWGVALGARHMTVSTSGLAPQIRKLAELPTQIRLAVSLHGATDDIRNRIMPVNAKYPLVELLDACETFHRAKKQRVTFEYILIRDLNDAPEQALALATLARRIDAKVNLIPCNPVEGLPWERPATVRQEAFLQALLRAGTNVTLRREKGSDIAAACGQLRLQTENSVAREDATR